MSSWKTYQLHIRLLTLKLIVSAGRRYSSNSYNSDLNNSNNSNNKTVTSSRRSRRSWAEWWKCQVFFKMRVQPKAKRKDPVTWHVSLRAVCHWIIWAWNICKTFGIWDLRDRAVIGTWVLFCSAVSQVNKAEKRGQEMNFGTSRHPTHLTLQRKSTHYRRKQGAWWQHDKVKALIDVEMSKIFLRQRSHLCNFKVFTLSSFRRIRLIGCIGRISLISFIGPSSKGYKACHSKFTWPPCAFALRALLTRRDGGAVLCCVLGTWWRLPGSGHAVLPRGWEAGPKLDMSVAVHVAWDQLQASPWRHLPLALQLWWMKALEYGCGCWEQSCEASDLQNPTNQSIHIIHGVFDQTQEIPGKNLSGLINLTCTDFNECSWASLCISVFVAGCRRCADFWISVLPIFAHLDLIFADICISIGAVMWTVMPIASSTIIKHSSYCRSL